MSTNGEFGAHAKGFLRNSTQFIYDEQGLLIAEAQNGRVTKDYVYINGLPVAVLDGNAVYYIHTDHLGTPQKMTDDHQQVVWNRVAKPFGETLATAGNVTLNLRFPGQYHDNETGLDYNLFRSYDSTLGRYPQSDPAGLSGGINSYVYTLANPINYADSSGTCVGPLLAPCLMAAAWLEVNAPWVIPVATGAIEGTLGFYSGSGAGTTSNLAGTTMGTAGGVCTAAGEAEGLTTTLYHGSVSNYSTIMSGGLSSSRGITYVTTDLAAAQNAISTARVLSPGEGQNIGIIASKVSTEQFQSLLKSGDIATRTWPAFPGTSGVTYPETLLQTPAAIDLFNLGIVK